MSQRTVWMHICIFCEKDFSVPVLGSSFQSTVGRSKKPSACSCDDSTVLSPWSFGLRLKNNLGSLADLHMSGAPGDGEDGDIRKTNFLIFCAMLRRDSGDRRREKKETAGTQKRRRQRNRVFSGQAKFCRILDCPFSLAHGGDAR